MTRRQIASIIVGLLAVVAAGCGSSSTSKTAAPSSSTSPARNFQVATPAGQVSVSLDGHLPPGWPSSFPVPPGSKPAGSGSLGGSSATYSVAVYTTTTSPADTIAFYTGDTRLHTTGPTSVGSGSSYVGTVKVTDPYNAQVTSLTNGGGSYLVIALQGSGATTTTT